MGLSDTTSHVIAFVAALGMAAVIVAAAFPAARELLAARDAQEERALDRAATQVAVTAVSYDAAADALTLTARNDGRAPLVVEEMTAVVDGVPRGGLTARVDGSVTTLWGVQEVALVTVPDVPAAPDRVLLVTVAGGEHGVVLGDEGASAAGVGMYVGAGGNNSRHFHSMSVGGSGTSAAGVFKTKNAADTTVADVLRVYNRGASSATVTLSGEQVANATAEAFSWTVKDGATSVATMDYKAASPSATFDLPAGATYRLTLRLDLAEGSGKHNAQFDFGLLLEVG